MTEEQFYISMDAAKARQKSNPEEREFWIGYQNGSRCHYYQIGAWRQNKEGIFPMRFGDIKELGYCAGLKGQGIQEAINTLREFEKNVKIRT